MISASGRKKYFSEKIIELFSNVNAGLILSLDIIITGVSYAVLIYSGPLENYLSLGVILILAGSSVVTLLTTLFSSLPIAIAGVQNDSLPLFSIMAISITSILSTDHLAGSMISTLLFSIALATTLTGIFFYILGTFKFGDIICFVPYPVVGGFLAGVGWFLFQGGLGVLVPTSHSFAMLFTPAILLHWLPAFFFAIIILIATHKTDNPLLWPVLIIGGLLLFYVVTVILHIPVSEIKANGFLLDIKSASAQHSYSYKDISFYAIEWKVVFSQLYHIAGIALLSAISILLCITSVEVLVKKDIDFNRELRLAGIGNLLSGAMGGLPGYIYISLTTLNHDIQKNNVKKNSRVAGLLCGSICLLIIFLGMDALSYFPKMILGGLLMYFGLSFLEKWVYNIRKSLPFVDCLIIYTILLAIIVIGFLQGLLIGLIFSAIFFIVNYSKSNIIKYMYNGNYLQSNRQREPQVQKILSQHRNKVLYFQLQNYLFFGNAKFLLEKFHTKFSHTPSLRYAIFDFSRLTGIDSSATMGFEKIKQFAFQNNIFLILVGLKKKTYHLFKKGNIILTDDPRISLFSNNDDALEWCEEDILSELSSTNKALIHQTIPLVNRLQEFTGDSMVANQIQSYFEKFTLAHNDYLLHQGDSCDQLYYIESGLLTVMLQKNNHKSRRLRTISPGNTVGEMSIYTKQPRVATVVAEQDCILQKISRQQIEKMERENPTLSNTFHRFIIYILSERLTYANKQINITR
jgi:SulP family sulfate permease